MSDDERVDRDDLELEVDHDDEQADHDDDEVLTPDEVSGPRSSRRSASSRAPADKFGRWSMYAGVGSTILLVLLPLPIVVLALGCAGIFFGMRARRELASADQPEQARKRAKIGTIAGSFTLVAMLALVIFFNFFYEIPDKTIPDTEEKSAEVG